MIGNGFDFEVCLGCIIFDRTSRFVGFNLQPHQCVESPTPRYKTNDEIFIIGGNRATDLHWFDFGRVTKIFTATSVCQWWYSFHFADLQSVRSFKLFMAWTAMVTDSAAIWIWLAVRRDPVGGQRSITGIDRTITAK